MKVTKRVIDDAVATAEDLKAAADAMPNGTAEEKAAKKEADAKAKVAQVYADSLELDDYVVGATDRIFYRTPIIVIPKKGGRSPREEFCSRAVRPPPLETQFYLRRLFLHEGHVVAVFLVDKYEREGHEGVGVWCARLCDLVSDGHLAVFALGDGCDAYVGFDVCLLFDDGDGVFAAEVDGGGHSAAVVAHHGRHAEIVFELGLAPYDARRVVGDVVAHEVVLCFLVADVLVGRGARRECERADGDQGEDDGLEGFHADVCFLCVLL